MYKHGLIWASALLTVSLSGTPARATPINVTAPCDPTNKGDGGLRACSLYLGGGDTSITTNVLNGNGANPFVGGGASSAAQDPGILKLLQNKFITQLAALYGLYPDAPPSSPPPAGWSPVVTQHKNGVFFDPDSPPGYPIGPLSPWQCNIVGFTGLDPMPFPAEVDKPLFSFAGAGSTPFSVSGLTSSASLPAAPDGSCGSPILYGATANVHVSDKAKIPSGTSAKSTGPSCMCVDNGGSHSSSTPGCPPGDYPGPNPVGGTNGDFAHYVCLTSTGAVDTGGSSPPIPLSPCSSSASYSCATSGTSGSLFYTCIDGVAPTITTNMAPPNGTAETAYLQGAYSSALACFYNQVVSQLKVTAPTPPTLTIDDVPLFGGGSSPNLCAAQANQLQYLNSATMSQIATMKSTLSATGLTQNQFQDIVNCKQSSDANGSTLNNPQVASLRQQAQHLCAMRTDLEEAFYRLAECQISYLTQMAWENVIISDLIDIYGEPNPPAGTTPHPGVLTGKVMEPCGRYCKYSLANQIFKNVGGVTTNGSGDLGGALTAAWDWAGCMTCQILSDVPGWLGGPWCHPGDPMSPCDQSRNCPLFSPYSSPTYGDEAGKSDNAVSDFEKDADAHQVAGNSYSEGTTTQVDADIDLNTCMNSCYDYGVSGGVIHDASGALVTSRALDSSGHPIPRLANRFTE
jgi:hypothetical protein